MMIFTYTNANNKSLKERQDARDYFLNYIGPLQQEFESQNAVVQITFDNDENASINFWAFGTPELVERVQEYRKQLK